MLGVNYVKFDPMNYVIHYRNGKIIKEGKGLSFFYFSRNSSIVAIPQNSRDIPFIFKNMTKDYQSISVQGQITYSIKEPLLINKQLDFTVNTDKIYLSDDFEKLTQRLANEAQTSISAFVHECALKEVLSKFVEIERKLFKSLVESKVITNLGIEVMSVSVLGISPDPEMARALEAETRESLQQEADKAIYDRRNFAVEQERKIKESELNTEIAIEEKQKQIVGKKMETDLAQQENNSRLKTLDMKSELKIEEMNKDLVKMKAENQHQEADAKGYELETIMKTYRTMDWKVLNALNSEGGNARNNIALAFRELASNSSKIGNLNISPDLINTLLQKEK
jgi:regulator of protease activity HflC (stomatin/prohibitin superfamily)